MVVYGRVKPKRLGARKPTPVSLRLGSRVVTGEGSARIPTLSEFTLEADRHVAINVRGLPVCRVLGLPVTPPPWTHCERGVVGHGEITVLYSVPPGDPLEMESEVAVYNGGIERGVTNLWIRAYFPLPMPNTSLLRLQVRRVADGRYGLEAKLSVPDLAAGFGSPASFHLILDKKIVSATCPDGHLDVRGSSTFEELTGEVELPFTSTTSCTPVSH